MIISYNTNNSFRVRSGVTITTPEPGDFDSDALAYITAVEIADNQSLEIGVKNAINDFVVGCKSDGIWSAIKASCILMGARTLSGALVPLVGTAPTNNNFVSGDYNRKTGLVGNGSNKFLDTNRAGNADPQNSVHLAVYASTANSGTSIYAGDAWSGTKTQFFSIGTALYPDCRSSGISTAFPGANVAGFLAISRSVSSSYSVRANNTSYTDNKTSGTPASANYYVFANPGTTSFRANGRFAFYSVGEAVDLVLFNSRVSDLYTAIGNAIP